MIQLLLKSEIKTENDIVWARKKARQLASFLLLNNQEQIRLATAVSEIARNAYQYSGGGTILFQIEKDQDKVRVLIEVNDKGPGISNLDTILNGKYVSRNGMGVGITGAKKLVDEMTIDSNPLTGTTIILKKLIPLRKELLSQTEIKEIVNNFMTSNSNDVIEEMQKQNREILLTMSELQEKKEALDEANRLLEDTNRGVLALYAELDEKAVHLKMANESKTSFLSDMTHEFRSPLNSIITISQFLLEDAQEEKATEREKQIQFIIKASTGLSTLVNDLLDIAKIEAGKLQIRATKFSLHDLLSTLRGMMGPIATNFKNIKLNIVDSSEEYMLYADEAKVTQILRNLISNALKYTEEGEVTVSTWIDSNEKISFHVKDTGVGISPDHLEDVFSEFGQVDHHLQDDTKGTGLGLPLALKLAKLLGGCLRVESEVNQGSTFSLEMPTHYSGPSEAEYVASKPLISIPIRQMHLPLQSKKILLVDDDEANRYKIFRILKDLPIEYREACDGQEAWDITQRFMPDMIVLDLVMPKINGFEFLKKCRADAKTCNIQVILYTSKELNEAEKKYFGQVTTNIIHKDANSAVKIKKAVQTFIS